MENAVNIFLVIVCLLYLSSAAGYLIYLFRQKEPVWRAAFRLFCAGAAVHVLAAVMQTVLYGNIPVHNMQQTLSTAVLAFAVAFIYVTRAFKLKILGVIASIAAAALMAAVLIIPEAPAQEHDILNSFWLWFHIVLVFLGEAALALACGIGILYLLQERGIKSRKKGFFFNRLPSLDILDSSSYTCLTVGFTLLTFGLVTGFIYAKAFLGRFWGWDVKEVWSIGSWLFYAALLHCRLYSGWQGRKSAIMTIVGFGLLVFTFLGVNLLLGGYHQAFTR